MDTFQMFQIQILLLLSIVVLRNHAKVPFLEASENSVCLGQSVNLTCSFTFDGSVRNSRVNWRLNNKPLYLEEGIASVPYRNDTMTILNFILTDAQLEYLNFTCSVPLAGSPYLQVTSDPISLKAIGKPETPTLYIQVATWNIRVTWDYNPLCFAAPPCSLSYVGQVCEQHRGNCQSMSPTSLNAGAAYGLEPSTSYNVTLYATCSSNGTTIKSESTSRSATTTANIDSNEPNIILVNATEHACLGQNYDIKCLHPAIDSTLNGRKVFSASAPNWRVNGKVLLIEEIYSIKYSGKYETVLSITLNKYHFNNGQYFRYSCFLQLFNGDILESNQLEVQPLDQSYDSTLSSSTVIDWRANASCYNSDNYYFVAWQPINDASKNQNWTVVHTDDTSYSFDSFHNYPCKVRIARSSLGSLNQQQQSIYVTLQLAVEKDDNRTVCIGDSIKVTCKYQEELPPSKACDSSPSLIVNTAYLNFSWDICSDNVCSYQFNVSESRLQEFICEERYTIETDVCFTNHNTRSEVSETKSIRPLVLPHSPKFKEPVNPSDTSVSIQWEHNTVCFEFCSFLYHISWREYNASNETGSVDERCCRRTINDLKPSTEYNITVYGKCQENGSVITGAASVTFQTKTKSEEPTTQWPTVIGLSVALAVVAVIAILLITYILLIRKKCRNCKEQKEEPNNM